MSAPVTPARGTALPSATSRYKAARRSQLLLAIPSFVRLRPVRYAPMFAIVIGLLWLSEYPTHRVIGVSIVYGTLMTLWVYQALRGRLGDDLEKSLIQTTILTTLAQGTVVGLTGGLASPCIPLLMAPAIVLVVLFGRSRESSLMIALMVASTVLLGLMPKSWLGPTIHWPYDVALGGTTLLFNIVILLSTILYVTDVHQQTGQMMDKMREEILGAAAERAQGLESIGAKVAHELKNPLASVKGLSQLLVRGANLDENTRERLRVISGEVSRMEEILRDYLSFSRPLNDLRPQPLQLATLADDVLAVLEARAQAADVKLMRSGDALVVGDPRRLKEALLNIVSNALEATPPKGAVEVRVLQKPDGATLTVRDTGRGMGPEEVAKLGTPFYTTRQGGTGLGVVLARSVVVQHGGEIGYASEVGLGTTVTVHLPREPRLNGAGAIDASGAAHR